LFPKLRAVDGDGGIGLEVEFHILASDLEDDDCDYAMPAAGRF